MNLRLIDNKKKEGDGAKSPTLGSMCMFPLVQIHMHLIRGNGVPFDLPTIPCYFNSCPKKYGKAA